MRTEIEIQNDLDSERVTALANEALRQAAPAAAVGLAKREGEAAEAAAAKLKEQKEALEAKKAARRSPLAATIAETEAPEAPKE